MRPKLVEQRLAFLKRQTNDVPIGTAAKINSFLTVVGGSPAFGIIRECNKLHVGGTSIYRYRLTIPIRRIMSSR